MEQYLVITLLLVASFSIHLFLIVFLLCRERGISGLRDGWRILRHPKMGLVVVIASMLCGVIDVAACWVVAMLIRPQ
jgi:hypothetical protein